jgi:hypothetical protein
MTVNWGPWANYKNMHQNGGFMRIVMPQLQTDAELPAWDEFAGV